MRLELLFVLGVVLVVSACAKKEGAPGAAEPAVAEPAVVDSTKPADSTAAAPEIPDRVRDSAKTDSASTKPGAVGGGQSPAKNPPGPASTPKPRPPEGD